MIVKNLAILISSIVLISGCSTLGVLSGSKKIEVSSKPVQIDIIQPSLPREINLICQFSRKDSLSFDINFEIISFFSFFEF